MYMWKLICLKYMEVVSISQFIDNYLTILTVGDSLAVLCFVHECLLNYVGVRGI